MFEARKIEENVFTQRDRRADGGARKIRVTRSDILISRRYAGVDMRIRVPVAHYRGVALDVRAGTDGALSYVLTLAHSDADLDITLAEISDGDAVAHEWKYWAAWLGLPRLAGEEGAHADGAAASAAQRAAIARRRVGALLKHRPRFLMRRKTGATGRLGEVFTNEREIICYE